MTADRNVSHAREEHQLGLCDSEVGAPILPTPLPRDWTDAPHSPPPTSSVHIFNLLIRNDIFLVEPSNH